ncbi:hypothetical protein AJ80_07302 [Polytolypa hystricis UAMH7299]|uniref:Enoyl reductase (ER) domain-containing protein n=1 Tax=Polytolypa hystricis (strain UAMH7299) TaxID=1447883 RepID=A0A2B7XPD6_POLH7|nr:hypothetical protein AJ80_07302 [Polytolypa hystricis UAMH7299]
MAAPSAGLPPAMKAQFLDAFNTPYTLRSVGLPKITSPQDVLIKVEAVGYCHTDAVVAAGAMPENLVTFPHIGGHEFAGTIAAIPPNALPPAKNGFKVGDRVGVVGRAYHPCGECGECMAPEDEQSDPQGYSIYCPTGGNSGITMDGGFGEYAVVDARQLVHMPAEISAVETAPLMCAGLTIYAALKRCGLQPGQSVGIMGCGGGLGHLGLQFADKMGYKVVGVDTVDRALELARSLGTNARIIDARVEKDASSIAQGINSTRETDGGSKPRPPSERGLDAVIILPEAQAAFDYGMQLLRNRGRCVVVSFPTRGFNVSGNDLVFRDIEVVGTLLGSIKLAREMMAFCAKYGVKAVTKMFTLEGLNELVEESQRGAGGKLVLDLSLKK